jgi:hypothetical protein
MKRGVVFLASLAVLGIFLLPGRSEAYLGLPTGAHAFGVMTNEELSQCAPWYQYDSQGFVYSIPDGWKTYPAERSFELQTPVGTCSLNDVFSWDDRNMWSACAASGGFQLVPFSNFNFPEQFDINALQQVNNGELKNPRKALTCKDSVPNWTDVAFVDSANKQVALASCNYEFFYDNPQTVLNVSASTKLYVLHKSVVDTYVTQTPRGTCTQKSEPGGDVQYSAKECCGSISGYTVTETATQQTLTSKSSEASKAALQWTVGGFFSYWPVVLIVLFIAHIIFTRRAATSIEKGEVGKNWFRIGYILLSILLSLAFGGAVFIALFWLLLTLYPPSY